MRQGSPLAPCPIQVQNGIDHFADVGGSWVSTWLGGRDERFEDGPFLLGQITGVTASFHFSTSSIFPLFLLLHYITLHTASKRCSAFTLPHLPSCVAFTMRVWSRFTFRLAWYQSMACQAV